MDFPPIEKAAAVAAFGTQMKLAEALGISYEAVRLWADGPIPARRQLELHQKYPRLFPISRRKAA